MGKKLIKEYYKASKWNINKPLKGTDETREEISRRKGIEEVFDNLFKTFNLSRKNLRCGFGQRVRRSFKR